MNFIDLIHKKRRSEPLTEQEIEFWISSLNKKSSPPDYQISALLAFICANGMSVEETVSLTKAMRYSGKQFVFKSFPKDACIMDKHSTGGVGDKISLPLGPLVVAASENIFIPMIAGRGLGHTGGTVDKLESIPGFRAEIPQAAMLRQLKKHRLCFTGQTPQIAPADRRLYALRDVTGTVESIPLITASILSKKLSESLDYLLLDVKFGSGAFMQKIEDAEALAVSLKQVAELSGVQTHVFMTSMNSPLGHYSGHRLEIWESMEILRNQLQLNTTELSMRFALQMLTQSGLTEAEASRRLKNVLENGQAFEKWKDVVETQKGSLTKFESKMKSIFKRQKIITAWKSGYMDYNVRELGFALVELGGGRKTKTDKIDFDVGFFHPILQGQKVEKGQEILKIFYRSESKLKACMKRLGSALIIRDESFSLPALIHKLIE